MAKHLPAEFDHAHSVAFALHDVLVRYLVEGERHRLQTFEVPLDELGNLASLEQMSGEEFWSWCEENGYREILEEYSFRQLAFGLLSDACHFIFESLKCSEKGKLTVAFAGLRKPLQDNLLFLEWMLVDWPGFLEKFRVAGALDARNIGQAQRLDLVSRAMAAVGSDFLDPTWVHEVRYKKDSPFGMDQHFNTALHLVTTCKHYATEADDINFLFCLEDDRVELWRCLYLHLPSLLLHMLYVVDGLFKQLEERFGVDDLTLAWLHVGYMLCAHEVDASDLEYRVPCTAGHEFELSAEAAKLFWDSGRGTCHCGIVIDLFDANQ